jgi:hypothetical protein
VSGKPPTCCNPILLLNLAMQTVHFRLIAKTQVTAKVCLHIPQLSCARLGHIERCGRL